MVLRKNSAVTYIVVRIATVLLYVEAFRKWSVMKIKVKIVDKHTDYYNLFLAYTVNIDGGHGQQFCEDLNSGEPIVV